MQAQLVRTHPCIEHVVFLTNIACMLFVCLNIVDNAPPLCVPFPPFPAISICVRLNEIMREDRNIRACVNFELRITGTLNPLWTLRFTCIRFGFNGISFFRPSTIPPSDIEISEPEQLQEVVAEPPHQQEGSHLFIVHQFATLPSVQATPQMTPQPPRTAALHVMPMPVSVPPPPPIAHLYLWPISMK